MPRWTWTVVVPRTGPGARKLSAALVELAADVPASLAALELSERQEAEVRRKRGTAGVADDARTVPLHRRALRRAGHGRDDQDGAGKAHRRLAVASALFGLVSATTRFRRTGFR